MDAPHIPVPHIPVIHRFTESVLVVHVGVLSESALARAYTRRNGQPDGARRLGRCVRGIPHTREADRSSEQRLQRWIVGGIRHGPRGRGARALLLAALDHIADDEGVGRRRQWRKERRIVRPESGTDIIPHFAKGRHLVQHYGSCTRCHSRNIRGDIPRDIPRDERCVQQRGMKRLGTKILRNFLWRPTTLP